MRNGVAFSAKTVPTLHGGAPKVASTDLEAVVVTQRLLQTGLCPMVFATLLSNPTSSDWILPHGYCDVAEVEEEEISFMTLPGTAVKIGLSPKTKAKLLRLKVTVLFDTFTSCTLNWTDWVKDMYVVQRLH